MCKAARINQETTNMRSFTCNIQADQRCCGGNDTLEAQQQFAKDTSLTFVANEDDMYDAMDTEHYRYVTSLRRSMDRYDSHWRHMLRNSQASLDNTNASFDMWWQRQPDNWNTRKICGTVCRGANKYQITQAMFQYTLQRLDKFSDVIFVEDFHRSFARFAARVGWNRMPVVPRASQPRNDPNTSTNETSSWDPLMSALDDYLYEYARVKFGSDAEPEETSIHGQIDRLTAQRIEQYFSEGVGRNCQHPCCHVDCSAY